MVHHPVEGVDAVEECAVEEGEELGEDEEGGGDREELAMVVRLGNIFQRGADNMARDCQQTENVCTCSKTIKHGPKYNITAGRTLAF